MTGTTASAHAGVRGPGHTGATQVGHRMSAGVPSTLSDMTSSTVIPSESTPVAAAPRLAFPGVAGRPLVASAPAAAGLAGGAGDMSMAAPHDPALCAGRGCSRHHPSDHHMRTWPKVWRDFYGFSDRMCSHGVGHPDPDDVVHLQALGGACTAHACDGCCVAPLTTSA